MTRLPPLPHRRPLTLRDVSDASGVSEMTVSRVLRNRGDVSETTRAKVLEAARALGYVPNKIAGALASQRVNLVAVIIPSLSNMVFPEVMTGVSDVLEDTGLAAGGGCDQLLARAGGSGAVRDAVLAAVRRHHCGAGTYGGGARDAEERGHPDRRDHGCRRRAGGQCRGHLALAGRAADGGGDHRCGTSANRVPRHDDAGRPPRAEAAGGVRGGAGGRGAGAGRPRVLLGRIGAAEGARDDGGDPGAHAGPRFPLLLERHDRGGWACSTACTRGSRCPSGSALPGSTGSICWTDCPGGWRRWMPAGWRSAGSRPRSWRASATAGVVELSPTLQPGDTIRQR